MHSRGGFPMKILLFYRFKKTNKQGSDRLSPLPKVTDRETAYYSNSHLSVSKVLLCVGMEGSWASSRPPTIIQRDLTWSLTSICPLAHFS